MRTALIYFLIPGVLLSVAPVTAQEQAPIEAPQTIEEAQEFGLNILQQIPEATKKVWKLQALPLLTTVWNWVADLWTTYAVSWIHEIVSKVLGIFNQEWEARQPIIEQEFERERELLQEELEEKIPEQGRTLWERVKSFLPGNESE